MTGFNIVSLIRDIWKTAVSSSKLLATGQILHRISHGFCMQAGGTEREEAKMRAVAHVCPYLKPLTTKPSLDTVPF